MKTFTITKENITMICGLLDKFFNNKPRVFIEWSTWNCGFRKNTPLTDDFYDDYEIYNEPPYKVYTEDNRIYIKMENHTYDVNIGDKVRFYGNKIVIARKLVSRKRPVTDYIVFSMLGNSPYQAIKDQTDNDKVMQCSIMTVNTVNRNKRVYPKGINKAILRFADNLMREDDKLNELVIR